MIDESHPGMELSIRNIAYSVLVLRLKKNKLFDVLDRAKLLKGSVYMNLYDYMFLIAQKP